MAAELTEKEKQVIELAKFMHETFIDAIKIHGVPYGDLTFPPFEQQAAPNVKAQLAVAAAVIDRFFPKQS